MTFWDMEKNFNLTGRGNTFLIPTFKTNHRPKKW